MTGAQLGASLSAQWYENVDRYIGLKPRQFHTLRQRRRSPLLPYLPPRLAYWLYPTSREFPGVQGLRAWTARTVITAYNRLQR